MNLPCLKYGRPHGTSLRDIPERRTAGTSRFETKKDVSKIRPQIIYPIYKIYIFYEGMIFDNKGNQKRLAVIFNKIIMSHKIS